jgi:predicted transcriptional regulator/Txe/YoeB family toxin of Txe-Axe toxin-antitoxin module
MMIGVAMINSSLSKLYEQAKGQFEHYKLKEKDPVLNEEVKFTEAPPCIKQILSKGVMQLGSKNMIQYRLAAYFKSQDISATDCRSLMDEWTLNITAAFTHELNHDGTVNYVELKRQNAYVVSTVYASSAYGFSCSGIKQVPGVICDNSCKTKVESSTLVSLYDSDKVMYRNKRLSIDAEIVGRRDNVMIIPESIHAKCTANGDSTKCDNCPLSKASDGLNFRVTAGSSGILNMIENSNLPFAGKIGKLVGLARKTCSNWTYKVIERNVETIFISPRLTNDISSSDRYTKKKAFFLGHGIGTNQAYRLHGYTHISDKDGEVVLIFDKADELGDSLSEFKWTDQMTEDSKIFQPAHEVTVKDKFNDIITNLNREVIRMWGRENMIKGLDLVFHSVRRIPFQDKIIKGWLDALIIGDSGQGKTTAFERMMEWYRAGYIASGNSSTRAGLLWGVDVKSEGPPTLIWGVLPRNTGRLVMIDEAKNIIDEGAFGDLTRARSQGVVEVSTIVSGKASSETRLIIVTNPSDRRVMGSFMFPVESIPYLIPAYKDIRRFDFAIGVMSNEVPDEIIHTDINSLIRSNNPYTSDKCSNLIYWAWNLKSEDIVYSRKVQKRTLDLSLQMCKEYSSEIPLVEPADQRESLARISAAMAVRMFQSDGKKLEVTYECVNAAYDFLNDIYSASSLDYGSFSLANAKMFISDEDLHKLIINFKVMYTYSWEGLAKFFLYNNYAKANILSTSLGMDVSMVREVLSWLESTSLIKTSKYGAFCTTNGVRFFRELMPLEDGNMHLTSEQVSDMEKEF